LPCSTSGFKNLRTHQLITIFFDGLTTLSSQRRRR
jgi:hypothetical protein